MTGTVSGMLVDELDGACATRAVRGSPAGPCPACRLTHTSVLQVTRPSQRHTATSTVWVCVLGRLSRWLECVMDYHTAPRLLLYEEKGPSPVQCSVNQCA